MFFNLKEGNVYGGESVKLGRGGGCLPTQPPQKTKTTTHNPGAIEKTKGGEKCCVIG